MRRADRLPFKLCSAEHICSPEPPQRLLATKWARRLGLMHHCAPQLDYLAALRLIIIINVFDSCRRPTKSH